MTITETSTRSTGATAPVLSVRDLTTRFHTQDGTVHAVNGVSFDLADGEVLGVVGESGSGKSVTMMSLVRLIPSPPGDVVAGEAVFEGDADLLAMDPDELRGVRGGKVGFIFQDPMTSLNPVVTVGRQIVESIRAPGRPCGPGPSSSCNWWASRRPRTGCVATPTSCRVACASGS